MQAYRRKRKFNPAQFLVIAYFTVIVIGTFLLMLPIATTGEGGLDFLDAFFYCQFSYLCYRLDGP